MPFLFPPWFSASSQSAMGPEGKLVQERKLKTKADDEAIILELGPGKGY